MGIWGRSRLRRSVGIETGQGQFTPLILKGTPLPVSLTETFTTAEADQSSITIKPFEGDDSRASANQRLGLFEVAGIPLADPGEPVIHVTFHVDAHGALSITAKDADTGWDLIVRRR